MTRSSLARSGRIATLVVPSLIAWGVVLSSTTTTHLVRAVGEALMPLWLVMAGALVVRVVEGALGRHGGARLGDHLDVLTSTGRAVMWSGAAAVVAAVLTGWASLAVVGMLGLGVVYVSATWTALVAGGEEPWRGARVLRSIVPEVAVEGDLLREEVRLQGVRIPAGYRLFARGDTGRLGSESRYVVGSDAAGAEVLLESDLGSAPRGEHQLPALTMWLQDVLGLCRTPIHHLGATRYTALPRPSAVDGAKKLLGRGGDDTQAVESRRLPTEGYFRMREYVPGDDTRRIHWVRSLAARQLVVRLPDEIPPDEPAVRLILDSQLLGADALSCKAPQELLDALVRIWLGVGKSLADAGVRVNLVAAAHKGDGVVVVERPLRQRSPKEGLQLGARVRWQPSLPLAALMKPGREKQVVVSSRPRPVGEAAGEVLWVVVPEVVWTSPEPWPAERSMFKLPFPIGAAENRLGRRVRERQRIERARRDGALFNDLLCWTDWKMLSGAYVARPKGSRIALEVIP
jgi:uncharacterized protein (DUF58 family)